MERFHILGYLEPFFLFIITFLWGRQEIQADVQFWLSCLLLVICLQYFDCFQCKQVVSFFFLEFAVYTAGTVHCNIWFGRGPTLSVCVQPTPQPPSGGPIASPASPFCLLNGTNRGRDVWVRGHVRPPLHWISRTSAVEEVVPRPRTNKGQGSGPS